MNDGLLEGRTSVAPSFLSGLEKMDCICVLHNTVISLNVIAGGRVLFLRGAGEGSGFVSAIVVWVKDGRKAGRRNREIKLDYRTRKG